MPKPPSHIAILGGGLTGLSSAFHLTRRFPQTRITLLEASNRLGGWVRSSRVRVNATHEVLLEAGPRTLRPKGRAVLELINLLGLQNDTRVVPTTSPLAQIRYIALPTPAPPGLNALPYLGSPLSFVRTPINRMLVQALVREPFRRGNRPAVDDESVDSFLTRRFGTEVARVMGSALVHGIYAADSRDLSVRAAFGMMWDAEGRGNGKLVKGMMTRPAPSKAMENYDVGDVDTLMEGASVYTFRNGISQLVDTLESTLAANPNIEVVKSCKPVSLNYDKLNFTIQLQNRTALSCSHVVSALPLPALAKLLPTESSPPHLTGSPASSVEVHNLVFSTPSHGPPLHPPGFGFLVPRPSHGYTPGQGIGLLGAVFDPNLTDDAPGLTKITAMLGGPHSHISRSTVTPMSGVLTALSTHLGTPLPDPVHHVAHKQVDCIPYPRLGHLQRMKALREAVAGEDWGSGRMEIIGAGVGGVSVPDCIEAGRLVGESWQRD